MPRRGIRAFFAGARSAPRRFVLLTSERSGSTLLVDLLNRHPRIHVNGEIFNVNSLAREQQVAALKDPLRHLEGGFGAPEGTRAAGFKLFYHHATRSTFDPSLFPDKLAAGAHEAMQRKIREYHAWVLASFDLVELEAKLAEVWRRLIEDESIRIVHLVRRNRLAAFASLKRAWLTNEWERTSGEAGRPLPITLDFEECREVFTQLDRWERERHREFSGHDVLEITYEELVADAASTLHAVHDFLGVERGDAVTRLRRQGARELSEGILNWHELEARFAGTPWAAFFDEGQKNPIRNGRT